MRRRLSQREWMVRLFRLPRPGDKSARPGLVMVQIDGLSRKELERALAAGHLPFLKSLLDKQRYRLHTHYSGMPSKHPGRPGRAILRRQGRRACLQLSRRPLRARLPVV